MTGQEVLEQALQLLHYTDKQGQPENQFRQDTDRQGLAAVNQVYADLWLIEKQEVFRPLVRLQEEITLSAKGCETLPLGVAMWIAQAEGDTPQQTVLAEVYSQKRSQCPSPRRRRQDVMPWGEGL